ncbi:MAG: hypothetical protein IJ012_06575 [Clostridia bacterium]|nr:hypothetical protein [Clostridia bacterium]
MDMQFPITLIGGALILLAVVGVVFSIRSMIKAHKRTQADGNRAAKEWYVVTALCVAVLILAFTEARKCKNRSNLT